VEWELRVLCESIGKIWFRDKNWNKLRYGVMKDGQSTMMWLMCVNRTQPKNIWVESRKV